MLALEGIVRAHLEHRRPDKNMARYYTVEILPSLFGDWLLFRTWGRIGTKGRERTDWFTTRACAEAAQISLLAQKRRKGYVLLPEQIELPL